MTANLEFLHQDHAVSCLEELREVARAFPDQPALTWQDTTLSHAELAAQVEGARRWLSAQGLPPSCRVLALLPNSAEQVCLHLALLGMGATAALVDTRTNREALVSIAQEFMPAVLLCSPDQEARAGELLQHLPPRTRLAGTAGLADHLRGAPAGEDSRLSTEGRLVYFRMDREDRWRGAVFGLEELGATARQVRLLFSLHLGSAVLCQMSAAHYLSLSSMILPALGAGGRLVLLDRSASTEDLLEAVVRHEPRLMIHYRRNYWFLHRAAQQRRRDGQPTGRVRHAVVNADSPQLPFRAGWEELFDGHLLSGFATTWAGAFLTLNLPWLEDREGFVGKALPGVELKVLDETGQERPSGRWGEVIFRSPGMARSFTMDRHLCVEQTEDGWLRSQQMAMMDTDGFLTLADEVFDVIWLHGFKVSPLEIEDPLRELPGILDAAALNGPRSAPTDQVVVFVRCAEDEDGRPLWSEAALHKECERLFPPYLRPARIHLVDEIPYDDEEFKLRKELRYRTQSADPWRTP